MIITFASLNHRQLWWALSKYGHMTNINMCIRSYPTLLYAIQYLHSFTLLKLQKCVFFVGYSTKNSLSDPIVCIDYKWLGYVGGSSFFSYKWELIHFCFPMWFQSFMHLSVTPLPWLLSVKDTGLAAEWVTSHIWCTHTNWTFVLRIISFFLMLGLSLRAVHAR